MNAEQKLSAAVLADDPKIAATIDHAIDHAVASIYPDATYKQKSTVTVQIVISRSEEGTYSVDVAATVKPADPPKPPKLPGQRRQADVDTAADGKRSIVVLASDDARQMRLGEGIVHGTIDLSFGGRSVTVTGADVDRYLVGKGAA